MSKKSTQTNTPGWTSPPRTQEVSNLQAMVDTPVDYATPIRNAYGRAEQSMNRSYQNPLGAFTTSDVRDKAMRAQRKDLYQSMGLDLSNAAQQANADKFNRQATVAGYTQPVNYMAKSVTKTSDPWGTAIGFAGPAASVASGGLKGSAKATSDNAHTGIFD